MGRYIEVDSLWNCETCFWHQNGKCSQDVWCEIGESYRPAYSKLVIIEGNIVTKDSNNNQNVVFKGDINKFAEFLEVPEDKRFEYFTGIKLYWWQKLYIKFLNKWWTSMQKRNRN